MEFKITKKGELVRVYASSEDKEVVIPSNVKVVRKHAFDECKHVEKVTIPNSVESIAESAFTKSKLKEITLPSSVKEIGKKAFSECYDLRKVSLKCNLETLEDNLFSGCSSLEKIVIPSSVITIGEAVFSNCAELKKIIIPKSVEKINENAFYNCYKLKEVEFKGEINKLEDGLFSECYSLKRVSIPSSVESIGDYTFYGCGSLESIEIPSSVKSIGKSAFSWCSKLKSVKLPDKLTGIGESCFQLCRNLQEIELPYSLKIIGHSAFDSSGIIKIDLPQNLETICDRAFNSCCNLKEIIIPKSVKELGASAFDFCSSLKRVEILGPIKSIKSYTFQYCGELESISLPDSIESIGTGAFWSCHKLERIKYPDSLKHVFDGAFFYCDNLKEVLISNNSKLENISDDCFCLCQSLEHINLPPNLYGIGSRAFQNSGIKEITIPKSVLSIYENAFSSCENLEKLYIPETVKTFMKHEALMCKEIKIDDLKQLHEAGLKEILPSMNCYFNEGSGEVLLLKEEINGLEGYKKIVPGTRYSWCEYSKRLILYMLFNEEFLKRTGNLEHILPKIITRNINGDNYKEVRKTILNNKEFNRLTNNIPTDDFEYLSDVNIMFYDLFRLSYSLGAFSDNQIERQRASNFIINLFDKKIINPKDIHASFESLKFRSHNNEWSEFFMNKNNLIELFKLEKEQTGFISRICNSFEEIKEFGRSNRGSQRYRKVTVDMCREYLSKSNFDGVDDSTMDIAEEIAKYTHMQESFDTASKIRKEYLNLRETNKINDHILKESLFSKIEGARKQILDDIKDSLSNLSQLANESFSYEFLSKYDPRNFVLGKYCSCCAHLEGAGSGIMKASILHPDCQNLVIRNGKGQIIAKSTLYINRKQGYGVFNNVEINTNIRDPKIKKIIYLKYKEAVEAFATRYNEINKNSPINQINVGMNLNDLSEHLKANDQKSGDILSGINFGDFGGYEGDWQKEQYIVWSNEQSKKNR